MMLLTDFVIRLQQQVSVEFDDSTARMVNFRKGYEKRTRQSTLTSTRRQGAEILGGLWWYNFFQFISINNFTSYRTRK